MFARFMGTARFIAYMTIFVLLWIVLNVIGLYGLRWDPYPFILLNLFFSTQASYAAPLILLAQNRQADRDRLTMDEDRRRAAMQKADTEFLARELAALRISVGEVATRDFLRSELNRLNEELEDAAERRFKAARKQQRRMVRRAGEEEPDDELLDDGTGTFERYEPPARRPPVKDPNRHKGGTEKAPRASRG
jgi:uncharacterized membrane protein